MLMEMFTKANGSMIRLKAMASTLTWMVLSTKGIGKKTNSMAKEERPGLMAPCMKAITFKGESKDSECSNGQMVQCTKANSITTTSKAKESTVGPMEELSQGLGERIRCMVLDYSPGMTEGNTKGNT